LISNLTGIASLLAERPRVGEAFLQPAVREVRGVRVHVVDGAVLYVIETALQLGS